MDMHVVRGLSLATMHGTYTVRDLQSGSLLDFGSTADCNEPGVEVLSSNADINGTHKVGTIEVSPAQLTQALGYPDDRDGHKVSGIYVLDVLGKTVTIYDWKQTSLYDDAEPSPQEFWATETPVYLSIGSHTELTDSEMRALARFLLALGVTSVEVSINRWK